MITSIIHFIPIATLKIGNLSLGSLIPGLYMGWGLGANDAANIFGPAVTTRIIRFRTAALLISIFVCLGAYLQGPHVMQLYAQISNTNLWQAVIATTAAAFTIHLFTYLAIPTSTSQAMVGAVFGIGLYTQQAHFSPLIKVVVCWLLTPIAAMVFSIVLYSFFRYIIRHYLQTIEYFDQFVSFGVLISGCYGAYALGANNVANVTGIYYATGLLTAHAAAIIGGIAISIGALTYSYRVMKTVGMHITELQPFAAFVALLAEAITVHLFTYFQVPVSSSQAIVGSIFGIGILKGIQSISKRTLITIGLGWLCTPILGGILAITLFVVLQLLGI